MRKLFSGSLFAAVRRSALFQMVLIAGLASPAYGAARSEEALRQAVGVAQVDITPEYPVRLSGFGGRRAESEGVTQRIWAKALAFGDEKNGPAILITADNVCVPDEITAEVARRLEAEAGLKRERLTITATHTHTAPMLKNVCPTLFGVPIPADHQERINRYTAEFTDKLEEVALAAVKDIQPGEVSWGIGTAGFAVNRRTKGGPVDHDLPMLTVRGAGGAVRAVYFSYACHCVTLSDNKISGDWAGYAQEAVQRHFPGAIALASVGCGADSNPSSGVTGDNVEICAKQGQEIADEIQRLVEAGLRPVDSRPETRYARVTLPLAPLPSRAEWEAKAKREDAVGHHARVNLERLNRGEALPASINYPVQSWIFGEDLAIVFMPGETVVDYSLRLKREFDRTRLWVNGYSNDGRAYIPSERILKEGGYEGGDAMIYYDFPQRFAPGLEQKLVDAVGRQLPDSFKAPPGTEGTVPLSPRQALRSFRTKPGLMVELVAAEPLITDPVAIDWSADGRLWVCEMHDYPSGLDGNWTPGGRVKVLEDSDGDGTYDKAAVFVDGLPFPTGVTAWKRGVLICAAPDILYAEDTNDDGKADKVEKLFTGFPTDNYQARVNSLSLGLDNWIYAANGLLGGTISAVSNTQFGTVEQEPVNIRNRDFRFSPVTGRLETVSGLTQQGRVRDDWGNWFGCDNSRLLLHYPLRERYARRNTHAQMPEAIRLITSGPEGNRLYPASRLLERFNDPGHANRVTSACGLGIYRDTLLGTEYFGNAFTCEPVHNLVHREVLSQELAFTSKRAEDEQHSEFLASTDNWFRPVQARTGPDGAIYVVDMYRFLIEHPRWVPAARLSQIEIRAGADRGRIYRVRAEGKPLREVRNLTRLKGESLARALETANGTERDRVHGELLFRRDRDAMPHLRKLVKEAELPQVRLQALSVLDGLDDRDAKLLQRGLADVDPRVRVNALRLADAYLARKDQASATILKAIVGMASDDSLPVLRQLAFTLGESSDTKAGEALASLALKWLNNAEMRTAILSSARPHCAALLSAVVQADEEAPGRNEWIPPLAATAAGSRDKALIARAVALVLPQAGRDPSAGELSALLAMVEALEQNGAQLKDYFAGDANLEKRWHTVINYAGGMISNDGAPEPVRVASLKLLGRSSPSPRQIRLAAELLAADSEGLRQAAAAALRQQRSPSLANELLDNWQQTPPSVRPAIVSLLAGREEWSRTLLKKLKTGAVSRNEIALTERQRLLQIPNAAIRALALDVFPANEKSSRDEVLSQFQPAVSLAGSGPRGRDVFARNCAACHALDGVGHEVGPDLAPLRTKDAEYWLKNILDPNAIVEPRFVTYHVELSDDRSLSGLIKAESANSLTFVMGNGVTETVPRGQVREIKASALSLMPEGLEQAMTVEEMADLLAFVRTGSAPKKIDGNDPRPVVSKADGSLVLPAAQAEIFGGDITFERGFNNIGMWHGADDYIVWTADLARGGDYDVYLDYACASGSAGNLFKLTAGGVELRGAVEATGGDWSEYQQRKTGTVQLKAGRQRIAFTAGGPLKGALIDLRTVAIVPAGRKPAWPTAPKMQDEVLRDPVSVARFILDGSQPEAARNAAVNANPQFAAALIREMTRGLSSSHAEEYARIPWIWRVAIASGRRNEPHQIREILEVSLPKEDEPLRDWQAVVIGGGIINGMTQRGVWPAARIAEIVAGDAGLAARWNRSLELASRITDDEKVPTGTRYDALRMLGMESWEKRGQQLARYLKPDVHPELQMGAVSGAGDVDEPNAAAALAEALPGLTESNARIAIEALLRNQARIEQLLHACETGRVDSKALSREQRDALLGHADERIQNLARRALR